jgi:hypothetical protein
VTRLCRDCGALETAAQGSERCAACGSPRLVCHAELGSLAVATVAQGAPRNDDASFGQKLA